MLDRYAAKLPKRILNSRAECFKGFGETQRYRFEVAVRQHAVKEGVLESHSGDLHPEIVADGEIARGKTAGVVILRKEHGFVRSVDRSPIGDPSLERSACRVLEFAGILSLQIVKKGLCLQSRFGLEHLFDLLPNVGKRVDACAVVAGRLSL